MPSESPAAPEPPETESERAPKPRTLPRARRFSLPVANVLQASLFVAPHLLFLHVMPEIWRDLFAIFAGSLFAGWARIRSGSMVGPWCIHASANVTMGLSVAARTGAV